MAKLGKKFSSRGWTFDYDMLDRGGLVLGNVRHEQYNFARDVRVVRIWINPGDPWPTTAQVGTLEVKRGKKDVTGVGTQFASDLRPGQQISNDGSKTFYTIASISSATKLTLTAAAQSNHAAAYLSRPRRYFYLGPEDFDVDPQAGGTYERSAKLDAPPPFDIYTAKQGAKTTAGIAARYKTKHKVFGTDSDDADDYLVVEQSYVFAGYGIDPPHEPGAILHAARLFPLIKFTYQGKKIKSIRIDYRMEFQLDLFLRQGNQIFLDPALDNFGPRATLPFLAALKEKTGFSSPMFAGVFRDTERLPESTALADLFAALEKPVHHELYAYGLKRGVPGDRSPQSLDASSVTPSTWDNLHLWANLRVPDRARSALEFLKKPPSTPGAFHAVHMHWRWSDVVSNPSDTEVAKVAVGGMWKRGDIKKLAHLLVNPAEIRSEAGALRARQFRGLPVVAGMGGPLLDHRIPDQSIRFAITKSSREDEPDRWSADACPSEREYERLFFDPGQPGHERFRAEDLRKGEQLVIWYSVEIHASAAEASGHKKFSGTVLIHGLYFPHEAEAPSTVSPFHDTTEEGQTHSYRDPVPWTRSPHDK